MCSRLIALITKPPREFGPKTPADARVNGPNSSGGLLSRTINLLPMIYIYLLDVHWVVLEGRQNGNKS